MNKELLLKNHFHFIGIGGIGMSAVAMGLLKKGYSVSLNYPYSGGFITQKYYNHKASTQTLQIEINKKLYLDEQKFIKNENFDNLKNNFLGIIERFSKIFDDRKKETFAAE